MLNEAFRVSWPSATQADDPVAVPAKFTPDYAVPPGVLLQDALDRLELTQAELAVRTNLSAKHVNQVIKGVVSLSPDTALRLERALGIPSQVWNALEAAYQDRRMRTRARENLTRYSRWLHRFPVRDLINRGVLVDGADDVTQIEQLLAFFGVADPEAYDKVWTEPVAAGFRRAQHSDVDPYATAVWLRLGERVADRLDCDPYDAPGLRRLLPTLPNLTVLPDRVAFDQLKQQCAAVGVAVVYVREIKGCRACGAARWLSPIKAMILLSGRYGMHDSFWFSFFHEVAHLLLHAKRRTVIDLDGVGDDVDGQESEADALAASTLLPLSEAERLTRRTTFAQIRQIGEKIGIDPGMIAGRLAHRYDAWPRYARLRRKLDLPDESVPDTSGH